VASATKLPVLLCSAVLARQNVQWWWHIEVKPKVWVF